MSESIDTTDRFCDNGNGTVTDAGKGLMWLKNDTWNELGRLVTWHESQEYAKELNAGKFAGFDNWHVPSASEAKNLFAREKTNVDIENCEIHIDPVFTSGCGFTTWTTETRGAKAAMAYDFRSDYEFWLAKENDGFPSAVRLVRNVAKSSMEQDPERFTANGDGTVSDAETSFMWKAEDSYMDLDKWVSWEEANNYINSLNRNCFAGHTDWRMPTRKEIQSIYDPNSPITDSYGDTVYLPKVFPPGNGLTSWTKTKHKDDRSLVVRFQFYNGDFKWHGKGLRSHGVRPVRVFKKQIS